MNRVRWMQDVGHLTAADRVLQKSSFSVDVSLWEIFWPLSIGACLVLARPGGEKDTTYLVEAIQREHITIVALAPSTLAVFLDEEGAPRCTSLRQVMCGGEALSHELQERFFARMSFAGLRNLYGPTEASVAVITWACRRDDPRRVVPIGMPAPNTQVYVLDGHLQPVPVGVAGELHIGGVQLAWGYLGRPQMTAERFIPNPFGAEPGARLYKTGDMVRYLPDGSIEFLGRQDHQVKLRGFRIELGEIESVLRQHPAVRDAIVLAREDVPGDTRLAAYVVFKVGQLPSVGELRGYLQERLPDYMVPAAYVTLRAFPVNSSGKVDRRALPPPERGRSGHEAAFVRPRNGDEEALARIWANVLHLERIGVNDNFFDLGGHSLQAVQLISRSSVALGRKLSVRDIFVYPTIAKLLGALKDTPAVSRDAQAAACMQPPNLSRPAAQRSQPSLLKIEHRSLLPLFAVGKIPPVDSAVLGYLTRPRSGPEQPDGDWSDEVPVCYRVMDTHLGRIAGILLPRFDDELYVDEADLVRVIVEALEMAKHLGARAVSMAGLIPSATHYGEAVASAIAGREDLPAVTTGHATTTASVIMAVARILRDSGRDLSQERLGVLGVGSIGAASLRLVLKCLPHPPEIVLCDLYSKAEALEQVAQQLRTELGYRGVLRTARWQRQVPADFYEASLIIGATNVPDVLDIAALKAGTLVVDDSGPHCFDIQSAIRRLEERGDILFTEGGVLQSPQPISELRYVPPAAQVPGLSRLERLLPRGTVHDPRHITGCVFSGLLSARFDSLKPTIGLMEVEACLRHYEKLHELGFQAAELHCKQYILPGEAIRSFRQRFGAAGRAEG